MLKLARNHVASSRQQGNSDRKDRFEAESSRNSGRSRRGSGEAEELLNKFLYLEIY